jgi:hypothetical protein
MLALCDGDLDEKLMEVNKSLDELMQMNKIQIPKPHRTRWEKLILWFKKRV